MRLFLLILLLSTVFSLDHYDIYDRDYEHYDEYPEKIEERSTAMDWKTKLEKDILPRAKTPPFNGTDRLSVQILFSTFDHISLDESEQIMRVQGRFCLVWNDQRLLWNPANYNGISDLHVAADDVWYPKFKTSSNMNIGSRWDQRKEPIHIYVSKFRTSLVYVITCPRFTVKSGCALDMSEFPYDQHICSFMITVTQWQNINLYSSNSINEQQARMRHVLTRNDTRPTIGGFTILSINSTTKWSDGYKLFDSSTNTKPLLPIALQTLVFQRHYNAFMATFAIPSMIFVAINVAAALMPEIKYSLWLFVMNICLIGVFFRDAYERFPLYFTTTPDIVRHITVSLNLAAIGLFYLSIREIILMNNGKRTLPEKFPDTGDGGAWKDILLRKILSFEFTVILISFVVTIWYII